MGNLMAKLVGLDDMIGLVIKQSVVNGKLRYTVLFETGTKVEADAEVFELVPRVGQNKNSLHDSH